MMFGKLVNGIIKYLELPLKIGGNDVFTNDKAVLLQHGYKEIEVTEPENKEGLIPIAVYSETADKIKITYNYIPESEV